MQGGKASGYTCPDDYNIIFGFHDMSDLLSVLLRKLQHPLHRSVSFFHEFFVHDDFSDFVFEGIYDFVQRDFFHIRAYLHVSGSVESLVRVFLFKLVENAHFSGNKEFLVVTFRRIVDDT